MSEVASVAAGAVSSQEVGFTQVLESQHSLLEPANGLSMLREDFREAGSRGECSLASAGFLATA
jgi:hypothetical protein